MAGEEEKMLMTHQLWGQEWGGCLNTKHTLDSRGREKKYRKFTGGEAGLLGQGSCTTASIQGLHRGDFSLRPIHQGLARYFGGFSAQLQIIAMVTDASHDNFVTSETRNSCLKKQASSRNSDIYFPFFFIIFFCWLHSVLGVLSGFLMDEASIIWTVKDVSVHQVKVIFSYIIFLPLTRNAVYFWRKKNLAFL